MFFYLRSLHVWGIFEMIDLFWTRRETDSGLVFGDQVYSSVDRSLSYLLCLYIYINDLLVQVFVCTFIYILFIYSIIYLFTHFIFIHSFPFFIVWLSILSFFYIYLMFLLIIFVYTKWSDHLLIYLFISLYIICLPPSSPLLVSNLFNVLSKPSFYYLPRRLFSSSAPKCQPIRRCRRSPELRP